MNAAEQANFLNELPIAGEVISNLPIYHDVRRPTHDDVGMRVRHGEYGLGTIEGVGEEGYLKVRFDLLPPCHWAFSHIEVNSVMCRDLEVVE